MPCAPVSSAQPHDKYEWSVYNLHSTTKRCTLRDKPFKWRMVFFFFSFFFDVFRSNSTRTKTEFFSSLQQSCGACADASLVLIRRIIRMKNESFFRLSFCSDLARYLLVVLLPVYVLNSTAWVCLCAVRLTIYASILNFNTFHSCFAVCLCYYWDWLWFAAVNYYHCTHTHIDDED